MGLLREDPAMGSAAGGWVEDGGWKSPAGGGQGVSPWRPRPDSATPAASPAHLLPSCNRSGWARWGPAPTPQSSGSGTMMTEPGPSWQTARRPPPPLPLLAPEVRTLGCSWDVPKSFSAHSSITLSSGLLLGNEAQLKGRLPVGHQHVASASLLSPQPARGHWTCSVFGSRSSGPIPVPHQLPGRAPQGRCSGAKPPAENRRCLGQALLLKRHQRLGRGASCALWRRRWPVGPVLRDSADSKGKGLGASR